MFFAKIFALIIYDFLFTKKRGLDMECTNYGNRLDFTTATAVCDQALIERVPNEIVMYLTTYLGPKTQERLHLVSICFAKLMNDNKYYVDFILNKWALKKETRKITSEKLMSLINRFGPHIEVLKLNKLIRELDCVDNIYLQGVIASCCNLRVLNLNYCKLKACPASDETMILIESLTKLESLNLLGTGINDKQLRSISVLSKLQTLNLSHNKRITNEGVKNLSILTQLKVLDLSRNKSNDLDFIQQIPLEELNLRGMRFQILDGLKLSNISTLTGLTELNLSYTELKTNMLDFLATLKNLRALDLSSYYDTPRAFVDALPSVLNEFKRLKSLNLNGRGAGDLILDSIARMTDLQALELSSCKLTSGGIAEISHLTKLTILNLCGNELSANVSDSLVALTNIRSLDLGYSKISNATVRNLAIHLSALENLNLRTKGLTGEILDYLSELPALQRICLLNIDPELVKEKLSVKRCSFCETYLIKSKASKKNDKS
jgi:Leucine-rich repeat (LRR) protein